MQKPKLKKLPKKPKATSSNATLANYFRKVENINDENRAKIKAYEEYNREHKKLVSGLGNVKHTNWETIKPYKRKAAVKKHKRRVSGVKRKKSTHRKKKR